MTTRITNKLEIVGNNQQVKEVFQFLKGISDIERNEVCLDFNKIVNMPIELKIDNMAEGKWTHLLLFGDGETNLSEARLGFMKLDETEQKKATEIAIKYHQNLKKFGHMSSQSWRIKNWGTSSNAFEQKLLKGNIIEFTTTGNVMNLLEKLSKKFPEITFKYTWEECMWGIGGDAIYKDGLLEVNEREHDIV